MYRSIRIAESLVFIKESPEYGIYKNVIKLSIIFNYPNSFILSSPGIESETSTSKRT